MLKIKSTKSLGGQLIAGGIWPTADELLLNLDRAQERAGSVAPWSIAAVFSGVGVGVAPLLAAASPYLCAAGVPAIAYGFWRWSSVRTVKDIRLDELRFIQRNRSLIQLLHAADARLLAAGHTSETWRAKKLGDLYELLFKISGKGANLLGVFNESIKESLEEAPHVDAIPEEEEEAIGPDPFEELALRSAALEETLGISKPSQSGPAEVLALGGLANPTSTIAPTSKPNPDDHPEAVSLFDLLVRTPTRSRMFLAGQRTGKSTNAAAASLQIQREYGTNIFYLNLSDHDQGNREAFAHADCVIGDASKDRSLVLKAAALITRFRDSYNSLLVIDEYVILSSKETKLYDAVWGVLGHEGLALASHGSASGKAIWAIAPNFRADDLRGESKFVKDFELLILNLPIGVTDVWINPETSVPEELQYNGAVIKQARKNWEHLDVRPPNPVDCARWVAAGLKRIIWLPSSDEGGAWYPIKRPPAPGKTVKIPDFVPQDLGQENTLIGATTRFGAVEVEAVEVEAIAPVQAQIQPQVTVDPKVQSLADRMVGKLKERPGVWQKATDVAARNKLVEEALDLLMGEYEDQIEYDAVPQNSGKVSVRLRWKE